MGKVTSIAEWKNRDTVATLEKMLEQAKAGRLTGLLFACKVGGRDHGMGMTGDYAADPLPVSAVAGALFRLVNQHARQSGAIEIDSDAG